MVCFVMLRYVMLWSGMLCIVSVVMFCYVLLRFVFFLVWFGMFSYVKLCHFMVSYIMLCHVMLCSVRLCYVMLCVVICCWVVLCYVYVCLFILNVPMIVFTDSMFIMFCDGLDGVFLFVVIGSCFECSNDCFY